MGLRILQVGRTGQVAMELLARGALAGHHITALGRDELDLAFPDRVSSFASRLEHVDIVINGAAYTAVDKAEIEPELAMKVNGQSVGKLAAVCAEVNTPLIHLSTDYVFDGEADRPYVETDLVNPINTYGRSKLAGEEAIRASHGAHIILRTSWVYSAYGSNFVKTMLRLGIERDELSVVDDQVGAPTSAGDIADACLQVAERIKKGGAIQWGTYHFTNAGEMSWHGFANRIFELAATWPGMKAKANPIPSSEYPTPAKRPKNSRLDCSLIEQTLDIKPRKIEEALVEVLADLRRNSKSDEVGLK